MTVIIFPLSITDFSWAEEPQDRALFQIADAVLARAEARFPALLAPKSPTQILADDVKGYPWTWVWFFRYYAASDTYLAINEYEESVYAFGPVFGPQPLKVGKVNDLAQSLGSGMIRPGSGECVELPSPKPGTNAYYKGQDVQWGQDPLTGEWLHDSLVSWQLNEQGGSDIIRHVGSLQSLVHLFTETASVSSYDGLSYLNGYRRAYRHPGPMTQSSVYLKSDTKEYIPGRLLGPSNRYCVGQTWLSSGAMVNSVYTYYSARPMPPWIETFYHPIDLEQVVSIDTTVEVSAGTFITVEIRSLLRPWKKTRWIDIESGIMVKDYEYYCCDWYDSTVTQELILLEVAGQ
ncbi:MAG: hypothetical protein R3F41_00470 [Gammaproteobacteria bacterium]|nr:hypothetical protein [Pseudomonadales bacterium]